MPLRPLHSNGPEIIGWAEWVRLVRPTFKIGFEHVFHLVPYWLFRGRSSDTAQPLLATPPTTIWVAEARQTLDRLEMPALWIEHSERTWQFATALAAAAGDDLDAEMLEMLYVGSLLHDSGMCVPNRTTSFAATGAQFAQEAGDAAGVVDGRSEAVARAICSHISVEPDNQLGRYLQAGSMLDVIGLRVWRVDRGLVDQACQKWRRVGFPKAVREEWRKECKLLPHGRAAYARRPGMLQVMTYAAPLPR